MHAQIFLRVTKDLDTQFKAKCKQQRMKHTEVLRLLIAEYTQGNITLGAFPTFQEGLTHE